MAETISTQRFILGIPWTPVPLHFGWTRNTRQGWPLLTVETEANGDSGSTYERGPSLVGSMGSSALVGPEQIIFVSPYTISIHLTPSPSKLGRQSCRVAGLLICVSGLHTGFITASSMSSTQNLHFLTLCLIIETIRQHSVLKTISTLTYSSSCETIALFTGLKGTRRALELSTMIVK